MDDFLQMVTSDFELISASTGFRFNQYSGSVDWENLEGAVVDDIFEKVDVKSLSTLVASVLSYNIEKMSVSKKIFRFSQLIIDFLLHCKKHLTSKFSEKIDSMALCELCGKMFIDINYLKYHCMRRHNLNSCTYTRPLEDKDVDNLKSEIILLPTQLGEIKSNFQNKIQVEINNSKTNLNEQNVNNCYAVHKNKLMYQLIPQLGDNPMQTQETYWKQKYNSLEENYNTLKKEYEEKLNFTKIPIDVHNKYQQCDFYKVERSSKYVQTNPVIENTITTCSPKRPIRKIDIIHKNKNNEVCSINIPDVDETNLECHLWGGDGSLDRDFYELKKLRLEARMNITENNICEDYSDSLLSSDYVDSIKILLVIDQNRVNELIKNSPLMDLIKSDVKELVNKRLEEFYSFTDDNFEQDNILHKENLYKNQEACEVSICDDNVTDQPGSPRIIDCDIPLIKKNKTVMSKLKKKALRLSKVFSPDSIHKNIQIEPPTKQNPEVPHSSN